MGLGRILGGEKRLRALGHPSEHGVGEPGDGMRAGPRQLDALAHRELGRRSQIQQLVRADTQGVAHIGRESAHILEIAAERIVQAPGSGRHAQRELTGERGVTGLEAHGGADIARDLARIATVLARGGKDPQGSEAPRGKLGCPTQCDPMFRRRRAGQQPKT